MCKLLYHTQRLYMWPSHFVTNTNQGGRGDRKEEGM